MITFVENGNTLPSTRERFTHTYWKEIPQSEYERLKNIPRKELWDEVYPTLPDSTKFGYGYLGSELKEVDGKYYVSICEGNSCD